MTKALDIFQQFPSGPMWIETVDGRKAAEKKLRELNDAKPGNFFAVDLATGQRFEARDLVELGTVNVQSVKCAKCGRELVVDQSHAVAVGGGATPLEKQESEIMCPDCRVVTRFSNEEDRQRP